MGEKIPGRKNEPEELLEGLMSFARQFLLNGEEPEPVAFFIGDTMQIIMLQLHKDYWADVLQKMAAESDADIVVLVTTGWQGSAIKDGQVKVKVMPREDPLRKPIALMQAKFRTGESRMFVCPFDQVGDDGPVTWCGEWKEWDEGEVKSRFLDGVFSNPSDN